MTVSGELHHVRTPVPVHFPESEEVPETKLHLKLRTLLFEFLELAFADRATIGSDQFVYWDPTDPKASLAPDAFVRWGEPDHMFRSWKVWERGAPQLAIEVISADDQRDRDWDAKLARYRHLGIVELVRFDPEQPSNPLRVWDNVGDDLVERSGVARSAKSLVLPGYWTVVDDATLGPALRLSHDAQGQQLYPTRAEAVLCRAEQRIKELEAALARRGG
jgi:Uma2 family endonuclease